MTLKYLSIILLRIRECVNKYTCAAPHIPNDASRLREKKNPKYQNCCQRRPPPESRPSRFLYNFRPPNNNNYYYFLRFEPVILSSLQFYPPIYMPAGQMFVVVPIQGMIDDSKDTLWKTKILPQDPCTITSSIISYVNVLEDKRCCFFGGYIRAESFALLLLLLLHCCWPQTDRWFCFSFVCTILIYLYCLGDVQLKGEKLLLCHFLSSSMTQQFCCCCLGKTIGRESWRFYLCKSSTS